MGTTSEVDKEDPKAGIRGHPRDPGRIRLSGHNLFSMSSCKNRAKGSEPERDMFAWYQKARRGLLEKGSLTSRGMVRGGNPPETQLLVLNGRQSCQ